MPGAGKTLVGLDVAIKQTYKDEELDKENGAVYLSGNGPLVAVLVEALARDNQKKCRAKGEKKNKSDSEREVREFIQIIHRYRDNMLAKIKNPVENGIVEIDPEKAIRQDQTGYGEVEHVAIFDEAQRSWTHKRIANYLKRGGTYGNKLKVPNFPMSEAEFLIWSLDQREDWAVIICLVGGGQEINDGEAGIGEWIKAVNSKFKHWHVYLSRQLTQPEYAEGKVYDLLCDTPNVTYDDCLHLAVSLRSFRAETFSSFVNSLLSFRSDATSLYNDVSNKKYPVVITRDIEKARRWLRKMARGTQQTGILEDAVTEIQVQGLELDFASVVWDGDVRCSNNRWTYHKLSVKSTWSPNPDWKPNTKWIDENNTEKQKYMLNAYRVLLTRARQGLVICVPAGNSNLTPEGFPEDPTRVPEVYDGTFEYLKSIGITEI